ncbi:MAG: hypothetical protein ACI4EQ_02960 [Lachnospiraceae bacterium]
MKIKIAILENDKLYLERLMFHFTKYYADKLEVYTYSQAESFAEALKTIRFEILLTAEQFGSQLPELPEYTGLVYLVEQNDIERIEDVVVIGKYQKPEAIYRQILGIYSVKMDKKLSKKNTDNIASRLIIVTSASGGCGTSTMAVAFSKFLAQNGKKVLYLSLEKNGVPEVFFETVGQYGFSDIIYLLKSKKVNIALRAESIVQHDSSGVYYFGKCQNILDMEELNKEDLVNLVNEICMLGDYEYVVVDMQMNFSEGHLYLAEKADAIINVCDGTAVGIKKLEQFVKTVEIIDAQYGKKLKARLSLLYNKFSSKSGVVYQDEQIPVLGGVQKIGGANEREIVNEIVTKKLFERYI